MNTPTPETDAAEDHRHLSPTQGTVKADFARKLERERDDWKGAGIKIAYELATAGITSAGILDGVCALKQDRDALRQVASDNSDLFDCLVKDMAAILKCEPKPHVILAEMKSCVEKLTKEKALLSPKAGV